MVTMKRNKLNCNELGLLVKTNKLVSTKLRSRGSPQCLHNTGALYLMIPRGPERHQTPVSPVPFGPMLLDGLSFCHLSVHRWLPPSDCDDARI